MDDDVDDDVLVLENVLGDVVAVVVEWVEAIVEFEEEVVEVEGDVLLFIFRTSVLFINNVLFCPLTVKNISVTTVSVLTSKETLFSVASSCFVSNCSPLYMLTVTMLSVFCKTYASSFSKITSPIYRTRPMVVVI